MYVLYFAMGAEMTSEKTNVFSVTRSNQVQTSQNSLDLRRYLSLCFGLMIIIIVTIL